MTLHDWSEIAAVAQGLAALLALLAGIYTAWLVYTQIKTAHNDNRTQIESQREENRKWKTIDICAQYEFSDTVSVAAAKVWAAFNDGNPTDETCKEIYRDATVVLNYLDGIAIGVSQGLYIEALARDHLKQIVRFHVERLLDQKNCERLRLDLNDYQFVRAMNEKWKQDKPYYQDLRPC